MSCSGCGEFDAAWPGEPAKNRHPWYPPKEDGSDPIAQGKLVVNNTLTGRKDVFVRLLAAIGPGIFIIGTGGVMSMAKAGAEYGMTRASVLRVSYSDALGLFDSLRDGLFAPQAGRGNHQEEVR